MSMQPPLTGLSGAGASGSPRILIEPAVLLHVYRFRQTHCWSREAGGQLFAFVDGHDWRVAEATGPRRSDLRSRFGFAGNRSQDQEDIQQRFGLGLHYVGDWHTHPQASPRPSTTDIDSMTRMVAASRHELPGFLMMIVGTQPSHEGLWISLHSPTGIWEELSIAEVPDDNQT